MTSDVSARARLHDDGRRPDVVTFLTVHLVLLFGISADQVLGPLGAIGSPATLLSVAAAAWWVVGILHPGLEPDTGRQPIRLVLLVHAWYMLASYVIAMTRPVTPLEETGSLRAAITIVGLTGLALLVCDGVEDRRRFDRLVHVAILAATFFASIGILQWATGFGFELDLPGLSWNTDGGQTAHDRGSFTRPWGTALHPIEYSVVNAAMLPLAINRALLLSHGPARTRALACAGLIALSVPLSISRSGLVVLPVGLAVVALGWSWRQRRQALLIGLAAVPFLWLLIPGLVGTLIGLFTDTGSDVSIQARLDRIPRIMAVIRERPWLGLGNGTWSVEDYFLVDNEFFITTMETGIVGAVLTFVLVGTAVAMGLWMRYRPAATYADGQMGLACAGTILGLTASLFTFDAFYYRITSSVLFLTIGMVGVLWRFTRAPDDDTPTASEDRSAATAPRRQPDEVPA